MPEGGNEVPGTLDVDPAEHAGAESPGNLDRSTPAKVPCEEVPPHLPRRRVGDDEPIAPGRPTAARRFFQMNGAGGRVVHDPYAHVSQPARQVRVIEDGMDVV